MYILHIPLSQTPGCEEREQQRSSCAASSGKKQKNSLVVEAALHLVETRTTRTVRVVIGSVQWWRAGQQGVCFVEVGSVPCGGCLMER